MSGTDFRWKGLGCSGYGNRKCSIRLRSDCCTSHWGSFTPNSSNDVFIMHYQDLSLELKGLPQTLKTSSTLLSHLHLTLPLALRVPVCSVLLAFSKPNFFPLDSQIVMQDSSLQRTRVQCSRVLWQCCTPLQLTPGIEHCDFKLVCSCSAMETLFRKLLTHSSCADAASRGSQELGSEWCNRGGHFYVLHGSALGGPALGVCVIYYFMANASMYFHNTCTYNWIEQI